MTDQTRPTAGWYPHPSQPGAQRYWDGQQWTDHVRPIGQPQPVPTPEVNILGIFALVAAIVGFIFACFPGALIVGWILLPIAFVLSLVALFQAGHKWPAITALIVTIVGTLAGFIVFFAVVADSVGKAVDKASDSRAAEYEVTIDATHQSRDYEGKPALVVDFTFTNNSPDDANFLFSTTAKAFQNGVELEDAYLTKSDSGNALKDIKPGKSIALQEAFVLGDATDVTIEVTDAFSLNDIVYATKNIRIKASADGSFGKPRSDYKVTIDDAQKTQDYEGKPALVVDLTFTNNGKDAESFIFAITVKAFQNGIELEDGYLMDSDPANELKDIKPGKSIAVQEIFVLDDATEVTIETTEAISSNKTALATKTIQID